MADMYGTVISNTFHVRDPKAFREFFERYRFGDDVELWDMGPSERTDGAGTPMKFGGREQYPRGMAPKGAQGRRIR